VTARTCINFVTFEIAWFACVLGAAHGVPLVGTLTVIAAVALHLAMSSAPRMELTLLVVVTLIGTLWDSAIASQHLITYPNGNFASGLAPHWIIAMWALFATTLNVSLAWLQGRPLVAALLGAVAGPVAYFAGSRLGALQLSDAVPALGLQSVGWAVLMPLLTIVAARLNRVAAAHTVDPSSEADRRG